MHAVTRAAKEDTVLPQVPVGPTNNTEEEDEWAMKTAIELFPGADATTLLAAVLVAPLALRGLLSATLAAARLVQPSALLTTQLLPAQ